MTFAISQDYELIRDILTEPRCYVRMKADDAPRVESFTLGPLPGVRWVIGYVGSEAVAAFMLAGSKAKATVHFCMKPSVWGEASLVVARQFLRWIWQNTKIVWLKAAPPSYNRLALQLALKVGFHPEGIERAKGKKNGKPFNLCWLSMERPREFVL